MHSERGLYLDIESLDDVPLNKGLSCWLDLDTGHFRLQHNDEFSEMPKIVVFEFDPVFDAEKVRFEQLLYKYADFYEYHSRPGIPSQLDEDRSFESEHIYEDLDSIQEKMHFTLDHKYIKAWIFYK